MLIYNLEIETFLTVLLASAFYSADYPNYWIALPYMLTTNVSSFAVFKQSFLSMRVASTIKLRLQIKLCQC